MNGSAILPMMVLLALATVAPLIVKKICGSRFAFTLVFGITFFDRRPLFGPSKTLRGVGLAVLAATARAPRIGLDPATGAIAGSAAMAGDLLSSFFKRRLHLPPSSKALVLDQIQESIFPVLAFRHPLSLTDA